MISQSEKYRLSISGEFFVAAQLQRLGVSASVTYGNAKRADVVAVFRETGKALAVEVKSLNKGRWPIGNRVPSPSDQVWVFVHLPDDIAESPHFYILQQHDLHEMLAPGEAAYLARYKKKYGCEYGASKPGVAAVNRNQLQDFKDNWCCVLKLLK